MPQNMSFSHTIEQIVNRTKTVLRHLGWRKLKPGDRVWAVKKAMGLKPGEKVERLALLEIVSNERQLLQEITNEEVAREGFPGMSCDDFMDMFQRLNPNHRYFCSISRIEFRYIEVTERI